MLVLRDHAQVTGFFITGAFAGWVLAMVTASAAMSHSQARMQRKVRYWQSEAALARARAERLTRYAMTQEGPPPELDE
jgi:hypothetical protein